LNGEIRVHFVSKREESFVVDQGEVERVRGVDSFGEREKLRIE
jgi:hypothetical protein